MGVHGMRKVVLVSRRGVGAPGAGELVAELEGMGAQVWVVECDVSRRGEVVELLAGLPAPLTAVVHTAGVLDDAVVGALDADRLDSVFRPKVDALAHLDELTRGDDGPVGFVVFSSLAGLVGGAGQGNYAAANSVMDAMVARRRAAGLSGVSLAWGLWAVETGMTAGLAETDRARMVRAGVVALGAEEGMRLFDAGLRSPWPVVAPVALDMPALAAVAEDGSLPALFRRVVVSRRSAPAAGRAGSAGPVGELSWAQRLNGLDEQQQQAAVLELVRKHAGAVLGLADPSALSTSRAFRDAGFDSLTSVELRNRLATATGLTLPATL
ncbi:beta-ketoacyl reductase, partial [Streptomyces sp. NPDC056749]|uniref:type I polyketide synthase n=1 Tax=Streptomyces sp. NPDC056749 TaxID=3345936 RepID=UPI00367D9B68